MDEAHILAGLGWASIDLGHYAEAEHYYREAEALSSRLHSIDTIAYVKLGWAFVDLAQGRMETARRLAQEGMILAREFNATSNESVALFILSLLASMGGDNVTARQLAEQSLRTSPVRYFRSYTDWSLAIAHCGLGNGEMAWRYLRSSLETLRVDSAFSRLLAVAVVLLGQQGNDEGAVEVLGSVYSDPRSARGWMEQWRPLTKERARLRSHLGAIVFQRLWDRGARSTPQPLPKTWTGIRRLNRQDLRQVVGLIFGFRRKKFVGVVFVLQREKPLIGLGVVGRTDRLCRILTHRVHIHTGVQAGSMAAWKSRCPMDVAFTLHGVIPSRKYREVV